MNNHRHHQNLVEPDNTSVSYDSAELESETGYPYHHHNGSGDDGGSLATAQMLNDHHNPHHHHHHGDSDSDATSVVHDMHLALLYLLSNPEEFQRALAARPSRGATTLHEWNAEYEDNESLVETTVTTTDIDAASRIHTSNNNNNNTTPLPFVVFADDAEVVLPAAHTASQLFGLEKVTGMELEAAAGLPALSQLFLRWLALMPGGDHLNIIDPPGLTVMRIAGGRYRVTAAHRVVWTWMNEFPEFLHSNNSNHPYGTPSSNLFLDTFGASGSGVGYDDPSDSPPRSNNNNNLEGQLRPGDLVTLTIVDVFETDNQGKLLSYCPTFDNRAVTKTNATTENLRKSTAHLAKLIGRAQKSSLARKISFYSTQMAMALKERVEEAVYPNPKLSPQPPPAVVSSGSASQSFSPTAAAMGSFSTATTSPSVASRQHQQQQRRRHRRVASENTLEEKKQDTGSSLSPVRQRRPPVTHEV